MSGNNFATMILEQEDVFEKIDRRSIKLRYNAYCNGAKKYRNNLEAVCELYRECVLYNKSLKNNPVEGVYDGEWKKGESLDLSGFPDEVIRKVENTKKNDFDEWGEPDPMEKDYSIEEILEMNTVVSVQSEDKKMNNDKELFDIESLYETDESLMDLY